MISLKSIILLCCFSLFLVSCSILGPNSRFHEGKSPSNFLSSTPKNSFFGQNLPNDTVKILLYKFANGIDFLMTLYQNETGSWSDPGCVKPESCINGAGFWFWGNAAHLLADYQKFASEGRQDYSWALDIIYEKNKVEMVTADSFDDEAWWGLAMIHFYQATNNVTYLNQAKSIVDDMVTRGKQTVCGDGGIYWDEAHTQVGSIANELLISLSSKVALIDDPDGTYKNIAINAWAWFLNSDLLASNGLVLDHYAVTDGKCGELIDWTFTYNSGVILSGLVDLYQLTKDESYLDRANVHALAAIKRFTSERGINDDYPQGNPKAIAEDAFLFKGVFVENLGYLALHTNNNTVRLELQAILATQLGLVLNSQGSVSEYGYVWSLDAASSNNAVDVITHMTTLYLFEGLLHLYGY